MTSPTLHILDPTTVLDTSAALVLFSGGQDSTTCLAWALNRYDSVYTVGFDYGQRHHIEMTCRKLILAAMPNMQPSWAKRLQGDSIIPLDIFRQLGGNALVENTAIDSYSEHVNATQQTNSPPHSNDVPNTFVPGRNLFFMAAAAALAWKYHCKHIVLGVCETDSSNYPDCRDDAVKAMQVALNIGMGAHFVLHSPLMWLDKAATWGMAHHEGGEDLVELVRLESHTCYEGTRDKLHPWGYGCGICPACGLRARGWDIFTHNAPQ